MKETALATILRTGPGTSVQDLGRTGMARFGVPLSGAMDLRSLRWVNHLLQNDENAAVLEISQPGFSLRFSAPTCIALAGALTEARLNGASVANSTILPVHAGDRLEIGALAKGARLYLGVKKGFQTPEILGSRSFYKNLTDQSFLSKESTLPYHPDSTLPQRQHAKARWSGDWFDTDTLSVHPGPDFPLLDKAQRKRLLEEAFTLSNLADRMGMQLVEPLPNELPELPTNPVFPGMVQLTAGGKLLVLLRDAQVTGGYPRVLFLEEESQWVLAQKKPGDQIRFCLAKSQETRD
ncbi:biotin-dependent carboxyltransferase family protein [Algoriphagus sp. H41]|uniref:Biotin-dependent carboxyltransferase family protein n=1 Tax=Algoriphagus oliviformis TaxID=2811231 RepID=A0ABS3C7M4_9BACT|nr:biotin-dependent carboxyltransferase family protein [Algoriphagus oliviformis]MBN7813127.1 biotin-dependent carboxyltransferase family protein [Algoriphagus oliviformis]